MSHGISKTTAWIAAGVALAYAGRTILRRVRRYDLRGKTVLITGGSRGLGLEIARCLSSEFASLILCARDADALSRAKTHLETRGAKVRTFVCDLADSQSIDAMTDQIFASGLRVDVLINNAGMIQAGPVNTMTDEDYEDTLAVHLNGPRRLIETLVPQMRGRGEGRIVNIASIGGLVSVPHMLPYCTSKSALVGYSLGLRAELAKDGIIVSTICPGLMRTGSPRNAWFKGRHQAEYAIFKIGDSLPLLSMSSEAAAKQIVDALVHGDALRIPGWPARVAATLYGAFPECAADLLGLVNQVLPEAAGPVQRKMRGYESETAWSDNWVTSLTDEAAVLNNEIA